MFWKNLLKKKSIPISDIDYEFYFNTNKHGDLSLTVLDLGKLNIPTGEIVVCDPLVFLGETSSMAKSISPGKYAVKIAVAANSEFGERYAFAKLEISPAETVKWELAITRDLESKVHELKQDEYFGFPVDAGLGCFCDAQTQEYYSKFIDEFHKNNPDANIYDDYFASEFKKNAKDQSDPNDIGDWLNFQIPNTRNNVIMFHSGFGDGYYPSYWGLDKSGNITALIVDFQVIGKD